MRVTTPILTLALASLLVSCTSESLPTAAVETEFSQEAAIGKTVDKTFTRFTFENVGPTWAECLNDSLDWFGTADILWWEHMTPSGNTIMKWKIDYFDTPEPTWLKEQISGVVWNILKAENQGTGWVTKPDGSGTQHYESNEWYFNEAGDRLKIRFKGSFKWTDGGVPVREQHVTKTSCK